MRRLLVVLVMLLSFVAVPFAMALDGCAGMGTVCGASCSAPCASASPAGADLALASIGTPPPISVLRAPLTALNTIDAPPKSVPLA
ncbi:MAG: hypothetical protein ACREF4_04880 [Gammaproteobacteria bacterium]